MNASESDKLAQALDHLSKTVGSVGKAITPTDALAGHDATGGVITSLTEAVMGVTAGLVQIAQAINGLADAVRESRENT